MRSISLERTDGRQRAGLLTLIGIALVPVTVGGVLLFSLNGAAERLETVTAAIVNEDAGVEIDGQSVPLGRQLAGDLVRGSKNAVGPAANYTWVLTTKADAASGLAEARYTAVVTIPEQFSAAATSYSDPDSARQATIQIATSDTNGLADGAITTAIADTATEVLSRDLTKGYLANIYVGFNTLHASLGEAATGARTISTGLASSSAGTRELAAGQGELTAGASSLAAGLHELADGSAQTTVGTRRLATGAGSLATGASELAGGLKRLASGARSSASGAGTLAAGSRKLASGASSLASGLGTLSDGVAPLPAGTKQLADGADGVADGVRSIAQLARSNPDMTLAQLDGALRSRGSSLEALAGGASGVASGAGSLSDGLSSISSGIASSASGASSLAAGAQRTAGGATSLADGLGRLAEGTTASYRGARRLASGTSTLATGARTLAGGAAQVGTGIEESADGADELAAGSAGLRSALSELASGSAELAKGQSSLAAGLDTAVDELPTYSKAQQTTLAAAVAQPVAAVDPSGLSLLTRSGMPLLVSLALWMGAFAIYLILQAAGRRALTSPRSSLALALAGYLPGLVIGALQGLALAVVAQFAVHLEAGSWLGLAGVALLIGASFAAVVQGMIALLGGVGRFLVVVAAVLALASSLIASAPGSLVAIASILPTASASSAVLHVITGTAGTGGAVAGLVLWGLLGLLMTTAGTARRRRVGTRQLRRLATS